jgi:hypothetical protein
VRFLKPVLFILITLAIALGGIFVVAIAAVVALGYFLTRSLFGHRRVVSAPPPSRPPAPAPSGDIIEIAATEVKSDPQAHDANR